MILRFFSGSSTPAKRSRKRLEASTRIMLRPNLPPSISITWSPSPLRRRPWSTKIHVNWSPIAFCKRTPTTDESTPPESPRRTLRSPTVSRICAICISTKLAIDQSPLAPQIPKAKFFKISLPYTE